MARASCKCGNIMSDSTCPSEDIIHVYRADKTQRMLSADSSLTLWDFYTSYGDEFEYWYCSECKRVIVFRVKRSRGGAFCRINADEVPEVKLDCSWEELYVFTDVDIDVTTDLDMAYPLKDYLEREREYRYWYKEPEGLILAYAGDKLAFAYKQESPIP